MTMTTTATVTANRHQRGLLVGTRRRRRRSRERRPDSDGSFWRRRRRAVASPPLLLPLALLLLASSHLCGFVVIADENTPNAAAATTVVLGTAAEAAAAAVAALPAEPPPHDERQKTRPPRVGELICDRPDPTSGGVATCRFTVGTTVSADGTASAEQRRTASVEACAGDEDGQSGRQCRRTFEVDIVVDVRQLEEAAATAAVVGGGASSETATSNANAAAVEESEALSDDGSAEEETSCEPGDDDEGGSCRPSAEGGEHADEKTASEAAEAVADATRSESEAASKDEVPPSIPISLERNTLLRIGSVAYSTPYSTYGRELSPVLNNLRRTLIPTSLHTGIVLDDYDLLLTLAELTGELGLLHADAAAHVANDALEAAMMQQQHIDFNDPASSATMATTLAALTETDASKLEQQFDKADNAYGVSLELYDVAVSILQSGKVRHGEDVVQYAGAAAAVSLHRSELHHSQSAWLPRQRQEVQQTVHLNLGGMGLDGDVDAQEVGMAMPDYPSAVRLYLEAEGRYQSAVSLLPPKKAPPQSDDENEAASSSSSSSSSPSQPIADVELGHADAMVRYGSLLLEMQNLGLDANTGRPSPLTTATNDGYVSSLSDAQLSTFHEASLEVVRHALLRFEKAAKLYRRSVEERRRKMMHTKNDDLVFDARDDEIRLADALHNVGVSSVSLQNLDRAAAAWEESLHIYDMLRGGGSAEMADANAGGIDIETDMIVAETLQSLADVYMQSGKFEKASVRYVRAMGLFSTLYPDGAGAAADVMLPGDHSAAAGGRMTSSPPPGSPNFDTAGGADMPRQPPASAFDSDESLRLHLDALNAYQKSLGNQESYPGQHDEIGEGLIYEPDDLYEAEVRATIGSIYLNRNEPRSASEHLSEAVRLYQSAVASGFVGSDDPAIGDALLNLASAYYYMGQYEDSGEAYGEAAESYRESVGEGKNPFDGPRHHSDNEDGGVAEEEAQGLGPGGALSKLFGRKRGGKDASGHDGAEGGGEGGNGDGRPTTEIKGRMMNLDDYQSGLRNTTKEVMMAAGAAAE